MKIKCSKCNYINDLEKNEYKEVIRKETGFKVAGCVKCGTILSTDEEVKDEEKDKANAK